MKISSPPSHVIFAMSKGRSGAVETDLPELLSNALLELEEWARKNQRQADRNAIAFWLFKGPAIAASGSLIIWDHFGMNGVGVVAGSIAGILVAIDGLNPRGQLRNAYLRSVHDIRQLENRIMNKWRVRQHSDGSEAIRSIIQEAQIERERIENRLRDVETGMEAYSDRPIVESTSPQRSEGRRRGRVT